MGTQQAQRTLQVGDVMTKKVIHVAPTLTVRQAITAMSSNGIRHLIVVENGKVVGVLSQRDMLSFLARAFNQGTNPAICPVQNIMIKNVAMTNPSTPISEVAELMAKRQIGCLPVLDEHDELVGIMTRTDVLRHVARYEEYASLLA